MTYFDSVYTELISTQKLTSSSGPRNFRYWKARIGCVLFDAGVEYVLKNPKPANPSDESSKTTDPTDDSPKTTDPTDDSSKTTDPTDDSSSKEESSNAHDKWVSDDRRCRALMLFAMDELLFRIFDFKKTAKEIMDGLTNMFVPTSLAYRCNIYRKYTHYKMAEETDINDHINEMVSMACDLDYAGMPVPETFQMVTLMNSLPESWQGFLEIIMLKGDVGLYDLMGHLRVQGEWRKLRDGETSNKMQKTGNKGFRGNCYACGKPGHSQSHCPDKD